MLSAGNVKKWRYIEREPLIIVLCVLEKELTAFSGPDPLRVNRSSVLPRSPIFLNAFTIYS